MNKGKLGIRLSFYAVLAFILAFMGSSTLLFLLLGVVLLVEKDKWTLRQVLQAFFLCIIASLVRDVFGIVDFISKIPFIGVAWGVLLSVIYSIIDIVVFIFSILSILNVSKNKDANIPLISKFVDWGLEQDIVSSIVPEKRDEQVLDTTKE